QCLISVNEKGETIRRNPEAFSEIGWLPRVARETPEEQPLVRELATTSLGMNLSMPVMAGPAGAQAIRPEADEVPSGASTSRSMSESSWAVWRATEPKTARRA